MEHVTAFEKHSRFRVWKLNTFFACPERLLRMRFRIIVFHYSLFHGRVAIWPAFAKYLSGCNKMYKIAFFQDEQDDFPIRVKFLNECRIDCVYTMFQPEAFAQTYQRYCHVPKLVSSIPGYVSDDLVSLSGLMRIPENKRTVDIGYRSRALVYRYGKGGQEKSLIGTMFRELAKTLDLNLDICIEESGRLYGDAWFAFLANCKAVLGVESGVSIVDLDGHIRKEHDELLYRHPNMSFREMSEKLLATNEDNVFYRTISPRHFEAAAFQVCQILFPGKYSGIMQPMKHYVPLEKDFSNFPDVIRMFMNKQFREMLTENAYSDLIASGKYSYRSFIAEFDEALFKQGFLPDVTTTDINSVDRSLTDARHSFAISANQLDNDSPVNGAACLHANSVMSQTLSMLYRRGHRNVGIYGAGSHTRKVASALACSKVRIVALIDDNPNSCRGFFRLPILTPEEALKSRLDAVVLSSDSCETDLWQKSQAFMENGIPCERLYGDDVNSTYTIPNHVRESAEIAARMRKGLTMLAYSGLFRVAVYGAGCHTQMGASALARTFQELVCLIDDNPFSCRGLFSVPVVKPDNINGFRIDGIVISSCRFEPVLWKNRDVFSGRGIECVRLYA